MTWQSGTGSLTANTSDRLKATVRRFKHHRGLLPHHYQLIAMSLNSALLCLAMNIYRASRAASPPQAGIAVAMVTMNRAELEGQREGLRGRVQTAAVFLDARAESYRKNLSPGTKRLLKKLPMRFTGGEVEEHHGWRNAFHARTTGLETPTS